MSGTASSSLSAGGALHRGERVRTAGRWLRLENRVVLGAVCALVFVVSLPRLQRIAIRENELDALRALSLLSSELESASAEVEIGALLGEGSALRRRLADVELLSQGRLALRHGYLFDLVPHGRGTAVRAWPLKRGSTGLAAFAALPGEGVFGHRNDPAPSTPAWSGPQASPVLDTDQPVLDENGGWRRIRLPGTRTESY